MLFISLASLTFKTHIRWNTFTYALMYINTIKNTISFVLQMHSKYYTNSKWCTFGFLYSESNIFNIYKLYFQCTSYFVILETDIYHQYQFTVTCQICFQQRSLPHSSALFTSPSFTVAQFQSSPLLSTSYLWVSSLSHHFIYCGHAFPLYSHVHNLHLTILRCMSIVFYLVSDWLISYIIHLCNTNCTSLQYMKKLTYSYF